ncbi:MAG: isopentenyl-diphosphate delta-isomerase [Lewinella sp.]|nr:isopentenyl-diphosphate delta-isomerase [Lewinella sp.]
MPNMLPKNMPENPFDDPTAASRKEDHIELAFRSQVDTMALDERFYYEPLLAAHPPAGSLPEVAFGNKRMKAPLWVSSMTGGTEKAYIINQNLARACNEFGLGMGLGSCRPLLSGTERLKDFDIRPLTGDKVPLYANLGIAQIQELFAAGREQEIRQMCDLLRVDGLIVHVNPLQEAMQPEGDVFTEAPLATIKATLAALPGLPIIVKEVGQGMGPQSLAQLLRLPLLAIDTAANGGTNFSKLELLRSDDARQEAYESIVNIGHGANEMVGWVNELLAKEHAQAMEQTREGTDLARTRVQCKHLIISGGLRTFLDGYYLTEKSNLPAIYGQASAFLKYARSDYATLQRYVTEQVRGLELAKAYLRPRT